MTRITRCLRQPVMPCARNTLLSASSVSLLPCPWIRDMTSKCVTFIKASGIRAFGEADAQFPALLGFIRFVRVHPVIKARALGVAGRQFTVVQFPRSGAKPPDIENSNVQRPVGGHSEADTIRRFIS